MTLNPSYFVSGAGKLSQFPSDQIDDDPRGLVCMWEPPIAGASYFLGCDPTVGIVNWSREFRTEGDYLTDNAAIEIIRRGKTGQPDKQVCEFVAPLHSEDLADYINLLGRLYGLNEDDGQCPTIIEVYPGPGLMTQRRLIEHYGYTNLFIWKYIDRPLIHSTGSLGWFMSPKSKRDLWQKGLRHISRRMMNFQSEWLVEECADCIMDPVRMSGSATGTRHDDRITAMLLAIWFAHEWEISFETDATVESGPGDRAVDWQSSAMTDSEYAEAIEARFEEITGQ